MALPFQPQCLHSHHTFLSHHIVRTKASLPGSNDNHLRPVIASKGSVLVHKRFSSRPVFSRKKKKKNRSGSRGFARLVLKLIPIIASNLKAPPRQLQLIAEELGGGDGSGGGPGFWGGGSGWGWFDGWRGGGGRRKFGFWAILVACGLSLLLVGETESHAVCRILGLGLFGLGLIGGWSKKKGTTVVKNGVLGICFLGAVSFLGLRKEEVLQRKSWFQELALGRQIGRRRRRPGKFW